MVENLFPPNTKYRKHNKLAELVRDNLIEKPFIYKSSVDIKTMELPDNVILNNKVQNVPVINIEIKYTQYNDEDIVDQIKTELGDTVEIEKIDDKGSYKIHPTYTIEGGLLISPRKNT